MCIFQNEKLNCDSDLKITSLIFKSPDLNALDYHVRWNTGTLHTPKPTNIADLKTALLQYAMICHRSSLIRLSCDFERDFDLCYCSWQTLWALSLKNTERAADVHYWSIWSVDEKVVQSLIRYYVRLTEYSGCDCMFTWKKMNFQV